jgi:hypothetical protein
MVGPEADAVVTTSETPVVCVAVDEAPLIVSVNVPVGVVVVVATVRIEEPPARTDGGANVPVAPEGNPVTEKLTVWAVPEVTCVVTVYVVLEPTITVWLGGLALMEKSSSAAVTVTLAATVCVAGGELYWPVIVKPNVPRAAVDVVDTVSVEPSPAVTELGLKLALAPEGSPVAERLTGRGAPVVACVVTVYVILEPWATT